MYGVCAYRVIVLLPYTPVDAACIYMNRIHHRFEKIRIFLILTLYSK